MFKIRYWHAVQVERIPLPWWVCYILLGLALFTVETLVKWSDSSYPVGTFYPFHAVLAGLPVYVLAAIHYIDRAAERALVAFRPALQALDEEYEGLRYRLTIMPALPTLLVTGAALGVGLCFSISVFSLPLEVRRTGPAMILTSGLATLTDLPLGLLEWVAAALTAYHTFRQLRLVSRIHAHHARANLHNLGPLYAFSGLTARTAITIIAGVYAMAVISPEAARRDSVNLGIWAVLVGLALATFVWPLLGVHRLLTGEKARVLAELGDRMERNTERLHHSVDHDLTREIRRAAVVQEALLTERRMISEIPTWPWHPQALQAVLSALMLPVLGVAADRLLRTLFGG